MKTMNNTADFLRLTAKLYVAAFWAENETCLEDETGKLTNSRDARGIRYQLVDVLAFMVIAKLCGEDLPCGIAEWVLHRINLLTTALQIERKSAPHHSTFRRILS